MKKKIAALCFAAALLAACGADTAVNTSEVSETQPESISETTTVSETESETVSETTTVTEAETTTVSETESETETTESETQPETTTEPEPEPVNYRDIYKEKLMSCIGEDSYFDLFDVNSDGVPELFISKEATHYCGTKVYVIMNDELVQLTGKSQYDGSEISEFGSYAVIGISDTGIFDNTSGWGGITNHEYLKMENDKLVCVFSGESQLNPPGTPENYVAYFIDEKEVTFEEFNEAVSPYESLSYRTVGMGYMLNEATVNAVLSEDYQPSENTSGQPLDFSENS